ncbi:hypothetical protein L1987_27828 [Smallanthus sonchifolius]|uniref:Uncharacterized protein n=1 Tax=Smallanthus sonchifolius TaxID=185202 RepID=A0ACB9IC91_9ASTR|nr:hypothetical protein L1987_27828 [Smallanthus sonchifolius]
MFLDPNCSAKVVEPWGQVIFWEDGKYENLASGRLCIKTSTMFKIEDMVQVCVKGTQYDIHVRELFGWSPTFCEEVEGGDDEILDKEDEVSSESISNEEEEVLITKVLQRSAELSHVEGLNNINEMDFQIGPHETNKEQVQDDVVNDLKDGDVSKGNDQVKDQGVDEEPVNIVSEDQEESSLSRPRGLEERCYVSPANRVTCDNEYNALVSVGSLKDTCKHNGVSMIEEFNKNIELGHILGYDMTGCRGDLRKLLNKMGDSKIHQ